ncbi:hypothetical protein SK128_014370, partial [Halocaridina rubra]
IILGNSEGMKFPVLLRKAKECTSSLRSIKSQHGTDCLQSTLDLRLNCALMNLHEKK